MVYRDGERGSPGLRKARLFVKGYMTCWRLGEREREESIKNTAAGNEGLQLDSV